MKIVNRGETMRTEQNIEGIRSQEAGGAREFINPEALRLDQSVSRRDLVRLYSPDAAPEMADFTLQRLPPRHFSLEWEASERKARQTQRMPPATFVARLKASLSGEGGGALWHAPHGRRATRILDLSRRWLYLYKEEDCVLGFPGRECLVVIRIDLFEFHAVLWRMCLGKAYIFDPHYDPVNTQMRQKTHWQR
jgi:hypothetical protein